jgi:hypothetical protein
MKAILCAAAFVALLAAVGANSQTPASAAPLDVARFTPAGKLQKPIDMTSWVFVGTSLGMGYNPGSFNAANPGQFQVVLMEPTAYRHFEKHRSYAPGSMFLLAFYNTEKQARSISQNGFTQANLTNFEIHVLRPGKGKEDHSFYMFGASATEGTPVPRGNACVSCHIKHGAFDGTFAQFYPTLRPFVAKDALERASKNHDIR